ncbi:Cellulose biosynthesis protein BcsN [Faunimonas pinastri]|uniref:Cellulose biosynthesis protein BcsN n=1 Tax=Faunimonas pinastri TaxID=1855383 RepID=A0A1H9NI79_9HYPH|nr:cellulose biosynthesis protein BcsN [Faunimonas pinastri]SER35611.1 Cellulose biosynthesis protein BcsN [Faunimonas pinastri]
MTRKNFSPSRLSAASRLLPVAVAAGLLGACASGAQDPEIAHQAIEIQPAQAYISPPPGGPGIVGVIERRNANALTQEIALTTRSRFPGQNVIEVTVFGPVAQRTSAENVATDDRLSPSSISKEMRRLLPNVAMTKSPNYVQNQYGPFGYALGQPGGGELCMFAWQRVGSVTGSFTSQGSVAVRVRLCEPGATEISLLQLMYGYSINAYFLSPTWNPYGSPLPPAPELGVAGASVYPTAKPAPGMPTSTIRLPANTVHGDEQPVRRARPQPAEPTPDPKTMTPSPGMMTPMGPGAPAPAMQAPIVPVPPTTGSVMPQAAAPAPGTMHGNYPPIMPAAPTPIAPAGVGAPAADMFAAPLPPTPAAMVPASMAPVATAAAPARPSVSRTTAPRTTAPRATAPRTAAPAASAAPSPALTGRAPAGQNYPVVPLPPSNVGGQ